MKKRQTVSAAVLFTLGYLTLAPQARAVCQDACLPSANTAQGDNALISLTSGGYNTAIGFEALISNTSGSSNTATGYLALWYNTIGNDNTANGEGALGFNTTGSSNTATGEGALGFNTTGNSNTASGYGALVQNNADDNTATGYYALVSNWTGADNTATGSTALLSNVTGNFNTANGDAALYSNTDGTSNTAIGTSALFFNTTGHDNTAEGLLALAYNTTGSSNIALGSNAGVNLTTGSNNIDIGNKGKAGESDYIRIGTKGTQTHTLIAGISGATVAGGVGVIIDTNGHLGTAVSSERFKDKVKPMDKASEVILALKPVTFRYKKELDPAGIPQFGLVAEEVEKVNPDLVARDEQGEPYSVRYEAVNAMLLNEFLKEHRKVEQLEETVAKLKSTAANQEAINAQQQKGMKALAARLEEQASEIQKVNAQGEMSNRAPKMVLNDQ